VQSQVADLTGVRRGHVTVACSQALLPYFLPEQIALYRRDHPGVTFAVNVRDRARAEDELAAFRSDLALVFEPMLMVDFEILHQLSQPVCAIFATGHPLASQSEIRLRDCLDHPHVAPSSGYGVRYLLDAAARRAGRRVTPVVETESFELIRHYVLHERAIGFQIPIGLSKPLDPALTCRPLAARDIPPGLLLLGQMKGRILPVATSRFATQLVQALDLQAGEA
jgi:DNA-binding transcriptional LysR family regulator